MDSEEEGDSSDVVDDDDTDEYDDGESRRKKKVEGTKSIKGKGINSFSNEQRLNQRQTQGSGKTKGGRRDSRTAKRRRRDFWSESVAE